MATISERQLTLVRDMRNVPSLHTIIIWLQRL